MTPKAAPKATAVAVLLALALCVLGVIAGRDALIEFGALTDTAWIAPAIDTVMSTTAEGWMLPAGIAAAVVGLVLVVLTLLPRRKTHRPTEEDGVWIGRRPGRARISSIGTGASVFDRLATFVVGVVLLAVGLAAAAWQRDRLPDPVHDARRTVETWTPTEWASYSWWPWALTGAAVVFVIVGLRWLYAHRPRRQPARLISEGDEHASVDLVSAAHNAAAEFEAAPGISSATGKILELKGTRVLRVSGYTDDPGPGPVEAASRLRSTCAAALAGLAVEIQVLVDVKPGISQVGAVQSAGRH